MKSPFISAIETVATSANGDKAAFLCNGATTYRDLMREVSCYAKDLSVLGARQGDIVGIMLPNSQEFVKALLAVWMLGGVVIPLNPAYQEKELDYIFRHSGLKGVFVGEIGSSFFKNLSLRKRFGAAAYYDCGEFTDCAVHAVLDDVAIIIYTSGTTGVPKGVMLRHENLWHSAEAWRRATCLKSDDIVLQPLPFTHIFGLTLTLLAPLAIGASGVIVQKFDTNEVLKLITENNVTLFYGVPTMFALIMKNCPDRLDCFKTVRYCISGGAAMEKSLMESFESLFSTIILEGYGLSEAAPLVSINPLNGTRKARSVGLPPPEVELRIVGETEPGMIGEVLVKGRNVMKGYYKNPTATDEALKGDWLHTGDLGYRDIDGYLFLVDRIKDLIISGGYNIYPREVEETLMELSGVAEVAVVGVPDAIKGEVVKASIVLKDGAVLTVEDVRTYCASRIAPYKCPRFVDFPQVLPRNSTGKVLKSQLRDELFTYSNIETHKEEFSSGGLSLAGKLFLPQSVVKPIPVFVMTCGIGGRKEWFEPLLPREICRRGFALFTYDLRGHSPSQGVLDGGLGGDLNAVLEYLRTVDAVDTNSIILGGQCLGALLSLNCAATRSMGVIGIACVSSFMPKEVRGGFSRRVSDAVMAQIRTSESHSAVIDGDSFYQGWVQHIDVYNNVGKLHHIPMVYIHYKNDPVCPLSLVRQLIESTSSRSDIQLKVIDGDYKTWITKVPHAMSYNDPRVACLVGEWLDQMFVTANR